MTKSKNNGLAFEINEYEEALKKRVGKNLKSLMNALGWNGSFITNTFGVPNSTLSGYTSGEKPLPLTFLYCLFKHPYVNEKTFPGLTIDKFINSEFDFSKKNNTMNSEKDDIKRDFIGAFLFYLLDQTKPEYHIDHNEQRALRYGVMATYREYVDGELKLLGNSKFYKDEAEATYDKDALDSLFSKSIDLKVKKEDIKNIMKNNEQVYECDIQFGRSHAFIKMDCQSLSDCALVIMYLPSKRIGSEYVGGLGCAVSVTRGVHAPVAQKIILSRQKLNAANELIAKHLRINCAPFSADGEAAIIEALLKKMPPSEFDEHDRHAILESRLTRLIERHIDNNFSSFCVITEADDKKVYELIKKFGYNKISSLERRDSE